ncbi:unnamed protein product, partial [Polarella glacialis]
ASSNAEWSCALDQVKQLATSTILSERSSSSKRDAFAALSTIVSKAAGKGEELEDPLVADLTCVARLQRLCHSFGGGHAARGEATESSARLGPRGPPMSAEECLLAFGDCAREALSVLRGDGCE